jgi:DNA repair exonuclease SbcCD ATPase subunit
MAQEKIEVVNEMVKMSKGEQPAYIVTIPQASYDEVVNNWTKIIRQNTKSKVEEMEHELVIMGTRISQISKDTINIYSAVIQTDSLIKLVALYEIDSVFFSMTDDTHHLHTEKMHHHIKNFMHEFAVNQYKNSVEEELNQAEKQLKTKNKELKELSKQKTSYQKEIKESEQNIKSAEDKISSYEQDSERKLTEINNKKESMGSLQNDPDLLNQAKTQLKTLEKEKRNIDSNLEKEQKNIVKNQSNIEELTRLIEANEEKQKEKMTEIEAREDLVNQIKLKLHGIN